MGKALRPDFGARCRSCQREIAWVETQAGRKMPIDRPSSDGNIWLEPDGERALIAVPLGPGETPDRAGALRYKSHFATCPNAPQHRRAR